MTKKLLPIMIGAALTGSMTAAAADVTVFGQIDTAIVNSDTDAGYVDTGKMPGDWLSNIAMRDNDDTNLNSNNSAIGFKGSEDLGNGLKAIFMLDFQYDTTNANGSTLSDRDQWVGLAGNFGTVKVGSSSTSYKAHGAKIDPLYRTAAQGRAWGQQSFLHGNAGEEGEGRADESIFYTSPDFNGLQVMAHYSLDSNENNCVAGSPASCKEDDDSYGIGASYTNGGILVFADYLTNDGDADTNGHGDLTAWKVGGKFSMDNFAVYAQYEDIEDDFGNQAGAGTSTELDYTLWHVAGSYTMGNNLLYVGYGSGSSDDLSTAIGTSTESDQTTLTLAGVHSLSKRTSVYLAYIATEQDNDAAVDAALSAATGTSVSDPEKDAIALGLRHKF